MSHTTHHGRILVVDDEVNLMETLCEVLREEGFEVKGYADPAAALTALHPGEFDLLLADLMMPGIDGVRLLSRVSQIDPELAGLIMTGQGSVTAAVEAMRAGAADFVMKPFRMTQLLPVLERALESRRLRIENEQRRREEKERIRVLTEANLRLAAMAATDPLTGLANRRAFDETLTREVELTARGGRPLSLVILDVDNFKGFNDEFGHPAGDEVLQRFAEIIRGCCRLSDLAARFGGEEFALLLPATELSGAQVLAERIRESVEVEPWPLRQVTVSGGVAFLGPGQADNVGLVERADRALYRAKRNGRNRVETDCPEKSYVDSA